ncbi:MAG TPA: hypothetical protein VFA85_14010 [Terriglobales bacterium]|nr:hypothetical protein [Terriglobales bacterium]
MLKSEVIFSVWESTDVGYEARAVGHSIFAQADTLEELRSKVEDAVKCHFGEEAAPRAIRLIEANRKFGFGSAKGEFTVPDDFNESDPGIEAMFYDGELFPRKDASDK